MSTIAEELKEELKQRALSSDTQKYFIDWVKNRFRAGENPVRVNVDCYLSGLYNYKDIEKLVESKFGMHNLYNLIYKDGRTYITKVGYKECIDITEHEIAQRYAPNDVAKMDKINILEAAGFMVVDTREYGYGYILKIYL